MASAEIAATQPVREDLDGPYKAYNVDLKARVTGQPAPGAPCAGLFPQLSLAACAVGMLQHAAARA